MSKYRDVGPRGGLSNSRLYNIWLHMKGRCYRKTDDHYKFYGARGITVCEEWKNDFKEFYNWAMSNGYSDRLTIDRIDNNGNYEPSNCRWVNIKTQCNNRTTNVIVTINGETHNIKEWSEITGIKYATIYQRIKRGLTGVDIIKGVKLT